MNTFKGNIFIGGKIKCLTGLHIGGVGSGYEIGGMDNPVIRDPVSGFPYIPGSSLKGKMRSLMEWATDNIAQDGKIHPVKGEHDAQNPIADCPICRIFGSSPAEDRRGGEPQKEERRAGPTRLVVRDARPDEGTRKMMNDLEARLGLPKVEIKTENNINRITSATLSGPRTQERVPVGSKFDFCLVYGVYEVEGCQKSDLDMLKYVFQAMRLLEDSALGGGGSRGSGQICFEIGKEPVIRRAEDYRKGTLPALSFEGELMSLSGFQVEEFVTKAKAQINGG